MKHIITEQIETLPKGWADNLINKIVWGDEKMLYDKPKPTKQELQVLEAQQ